MGKSKTPKFRIIIDGKVMGTSDVILYPRGLENYVMAYAKSLQIGAANEHISKELGYIPYPVWARLEDNVPANKIPAIYARWKAAAFQVF